MKEKLALAKKNKKDEFYTQLTDIEKELNHYKEHFKNKVVFCNTNGNTPEELKKQIDDIRAKAQQNGHQVKIGVNAFIIARDTEEEAKTVLQEIIDKANIQAVHAFGDATREAGAATLEGEGNWAKSTFEDLVQYNDGFKTNLIGTPRQIAERIVELKTVGVDLILSGFLHFIEEVEYFGAKVLPLVRELEAQQQSVETAKSA